MYTLPITKRFNKTSKHIINVIRILNLVELSAGACWHSGSSLRCSDSLIVRVGRLMDNLDSSI